MFPEGTFYWEARYLDGRMVTRETAGCSAEHLDTKMLKEFRLRGRGMPLIGGILEVTAGISISGISLAGSDVLITTPQRFSKIKLICRKSFPLHSIAAIRETYLLKLTEGEREIVIFIEPRGVRILREEPTAEVA